METCLKNIEDKKNIDRSRHEISHVRELCSATITKCELCGPVRTHDFYLSLIINRYQERREGKAEMDSSRNMMERKQASSALNLLSVTEKVRPKRTKRFKLTAVPTVSVDEANFKSTKKSTKNDLSGSVDVGCAWDNCTQPVKKIRKVLTDYCSDHVCEALGQGGDCLQRKCESGGKCALHGGKARDPSSVAPRCLQDGCVNEQEMCVDTALGYCFDHLCSAELPGDPEFWEMNGHEISDSEFSFIN